MTNLLGSFVYPFKNLKSTFKTYSEDQSDPMNMTLIIAEEPKIRDENCSLRWLKRYDMSENQQFDIVFCTFISLVIREFGLH